MYKVMIPDVSLAPSCGVFGRAYVDCSDAVVVGVGVAASAEEDVIHFFVNSRWRDQTETLIHLLR